MWRIGTATRNITPPVGLEMSGFIAREFGAIGTHDPLELKVLTLEPAHGDPLAILALDLIGTDSAFTQRLRQAINDRVGPDWGSHLAVACTHTHAGPAMLSGSFLGQPNPAYLDLVEEMAAEAMEEALATAQTGSLRFGTAPEPSVARNRRDPHGPVDHQVSVLRAENRRGEVISLLVSYACHPTVLGPTNYLYSADYPGVVRRTLEQTYGGTALFLTGCAGQLNVGHHASASIAGQGFENRNYDQVRRIGRLVAASASRAAELATPCAHRASLVQQVVELPLQDPPTAQQLQAMRANWETERQQALAGYGGSLRMIEGMVAWSHQVPTMARQTSVAVDVQAYGLGNQHSLVFLPGESFVEIAQGIQQASGVPSLVASYCNQVVGYIPFPTAYPQGGYEVDQAYMPFGYPAPYRPEASLQLMEAGSHAVQTALEKK
jgi:neutral ceramidase